MTPPSSSRWGLITDHWRLKSLALVLAVLLFGAVAFAQNPITVRTIAAVSINGYSNESPDLVLVNFPRTVDVQIVGLASAVNPVKQDDIRAVMDLSNVKAPADGAPTQRVKVNVNVEVAAQGVSLQQSVIPVYITVDRISQRTLPLNVITDPAPGVTIDKTIVLDHATQAPVSNVTLTGAANTINGLTAFVDVGSIEGGLFSPAAPIKYRDAGGHAVPWPPATIPAGTSDVGSVDITITAHQNLQQKTVPILTPLTGSPACGYEVSGISVSPNQTVSLTGTPGDLAKLSSITLSAIDVSGSTSTVTSRQQVPLPPDLTSLQVTPTSVTVNITVKQSFTCAAASPTPTPVPTTTP